MPDTVNAFGQTITDEDREVGELFERVGYGGVTAKDKRRIVAWLGKRAVKYQDRASFHPLFAVCECAFFDPEIDYSLRQRIAMRIALRFMKWQAKRFGDIPGVNDGLMARWFWTHDEKYLDELIVRARRLDMVGETCRWMLSSVSQTHPLIRNRLSREPDWV